MPTLPFASTVRIFWESPLNWGAAVVRIAPLTGVPVPIVREPLEFTRNVVELPTWKFIKSPLKALAGLAARRVPLEFPPEIKLDPRRTREEVVDWAGRPATWSGENGEARPRPTLPKMETVALVFPILMPMAFELPIDMVPVASITSLESPVMFVPVKVSDANAMEAPMTAETKRSEPRNAVSFFTCCDLRCIEKGVLSRFRKATFDVNYEVDNEKVKQLCVNNPGVQLSYHSPATYARVIDPK
jgi:hypothetical protein